MPTSTGEANAIVATMLEHLSPDEAAAIADKLWNRVGAVTQNDSVRVTMQMIQDHVTKMREPPPVSIVGLFVWVGWVALHFLLIAANAVSAIVIALCTVCSWNIPNLAIAFPLISWVVWSGTTQTGDCVLTRIENWIRAKHRRPPIRAFLGHYIVRPILARRKSA